MGLSYIGIWDMDVGIDTDMDRDTSPLPHWADHRVVTHLQRVSILINELRNQL